MFALLLVGSMCALYFVLPPAQRWEMTAESGSWHRASTIRLVGKSKLGTWRHYDTTTMKDAAEFHIHSSIPFYDFQQGPFRQFDVATGKPVSSVFADTIVEVFATDDNGRLAAASLVRDEWERDAAGKKTMQRGGYRFRGVRLANVATGEEWDADVGGLRPSTMLFSPTGDFLLLSRHGMDYSPGFVLVESATGRMIEKVAGDVQAIFSPDGQHVVWEIADENKHRLIARSTSPGATAAQRHTLSFGSFHRTLREQPLFVDDATLLVFPDEKDTSRTQVIVWNLRTGAERVVMTLPHLVYQPQLSSDRRLLALPVRVGKDDWRWSIWDFAAGKQQALSAAPFNHGLGQFSPNGERFLAVKTHREQLDVFETATGRRLWGESSPGTAFYDALIADDETLVLHFYRDQKLEWRDLATGALRRRQALPQRHRDSRSYGTSLSAPTPDHLLVRQSASSDRLEPDALEGFLERWIPRGFLSNRYADDYTAIFDRTSGARLLALRGKFIHEAEWVDEGRALLTFARGRDEGRRNERTIACWDMPSAKRWGWIVLGPLAAGACWQLLAQAVRTWRRSRGVKAAAPASNAA